MVHASTKFTQNGPGSFRVKTTSLVEGKALLTLVHHVISFYSNTPWDFWFDKNI